MLMIVAVTAVVTVTGERSQSPGQRDASASSAKVFEAQRFSPSLAFAFQPRPLSKGRDVESMPKRRGSVSLPGQPMRYPNHYFAKSSCRDSARLKMSASSVTVEEATSASFEQAQSIGFSLGTTLAARLQRGETDAFCPEKQALHALLSHSDGARGFYVTTLTAPELDILFEEPINASMLDAIKASPEPNAKLLAMNLAMSTATELAHVANGNDEFAKGSALTRTRTRALISSLLLDSSFPALKQHLQDLLAAIVKPSTSTPDVEAYRAFLKRWGYNEQMLEAIAAQVKPVLGL